MKWSRLPVASGTGRHRRHGGTQSYRFGPFLVDRRSACLRRDGVVVPLRPKSFDVLAYLAQHPGRLVPKSELIDNVWQNVTSRQIRWFNASRTSGRRCRTTPSHHRNRVQTRLSVRLAGGCDRRRRSVPERGKPRGRALPLPIGLPLRCCRSTTRAAIRSGLFRRRHIRGPDHRPVPHPLAVRHRAQLDLRLQGPAVDVRQFASELGVRYVLEGSVRRAGQRLRISAQLIDAVTGGHHWAEQYDRELGDIFAIQVRSPAAWSPRSSRVCWPRKAFAHFRARPAISAPGSWWRGRKPMSGVSTER